MIKIAVVDSFGEFLSGAQTKLEILTGNKTPARLELWTLWFMVITGLLNKDFYDIWWTFIN